MDAAPDDDDAAATSELAAPGLRIAFTGGGLGEVSVFDNATFSTIATCRASCTVPVTPGQSVQITAATPQVYGGLSGACTASGSFCDVTAGAGQTRVTATFTRAPGEVFTKLFDDGAIQSAAYDGAGRLIVASHSQLTKLSPTGATVWQLPLAVCNVATGPNNTIYAQSTTSVMKLAGNGTTLWTQPLDPNAVGCGRDDSHFEGFVHNIAVASDGAVAIHGDTGVARWDRNGALTWSIAAGGEDIHGLAIDLHGVVVITVESANAESMDLRRFAADGTELPGQEEVTPQHTGMFVIDPVGRFLITSSGHSHTDALGHSVRLSDADFAPNGIAAASSDAVWLFEDNDNDFFARTWTMQRFHADGTLASSYVAVPGHSQASSPDLGTSPHDLAGALDGHVAVVGEFNARDSVFRGWVTAFAP